MFSTTKSTLTELAKKPEIGERRNLIVAGLKACAAAIAVFCTLGLAWHKSSKVRGAFFCKPVSKRLAEDVAGKMENEATEKQNEVKRLGPGRKAASAA